MVAGFVAEELVKPHGEVAETAAPPSAPSAPAAIEPVSSLMAKADVAAGQETSKKCQTCHDFTKGGPNKVGPNLWGVVGSKAVAVAGYSFSDAMKQRADKLWTYEELNQFLAGPRVYIPGTKMTFTGLPKLQDRANIIAWLRQQSDSPQPLPSDADVAAAQKAYADAKAGVAKPAAATTASTAQPAATQTAAAEVAPIADRLKKADPAKGELISKKCQACHDFTKGAVRSRWGARPVSLWPARSLIRTADRPRAASQNVPQSQGTRGYRHQRHQRGQSGRLPRGCR